MPKPASTRVSVLVCALGVALLLPGTASAQGKGGAKAAKKDPDGVRGISPFWEAVNRGDSAYVARDFEKSIGEYREAITKEPQNALGHYRLAEAQLAKGDLTEAEASLTNALRFAGNNPPLRAKIVFVQADLKERAKQYDAATAKWTEYEQLAAKPESKAYAASAVERKKAIATWQQMVKDYSVVKERIAKRLAEATK